MPAQPETTHTYETATHDAFFRSLQYCSEAGQSLDNS